MTFAVRTEGLAKRYGRDAGRGRRRPAGRRPARSSAWWGPTARARRRRSRCWPRCSCRPAGDAEIAGVDVAASPTRCVASSATCPTAFGVYDDMRVWEYLDFFARCYGLPATRRRQMIGDLLELVDLADKRDAYVQALSRGMQQRLCLAHALVHDPQRAAARRAGVRSRPAGARRAARAAARAARAGQDHRHQQPHPARARGAVHRASRSSTTAGCWPRDASADIEARLRAGARARGPRPR